MVSQGGEVREAGGLARAADRAAAGRAVREAVPRSSLGDWTPTPDRDPVAVLDAQDASRAQDLVPLRHERMAATPFTFFRGAAAVFAADLAPMPRTGLEVQLCGDAHLANFGIFASPDRAQVFDLNDFDETLPGPFEWDLLRLVASFEVAARDRGFDDPDRVLIVTDAVLAYVGAMREYSRMGHLDVWYDRMTVDDIAARWGGGASKEVMRRFQHNVEKARSKDRLRAFDRLVQVTDGEPRFRSDPPVLVPVSELFGADEAARLMGTIDHALRMYRRTLPLDRRALLDRYRFVDLARKVVGVGSVGTRCWVALLVGDDDRDPLFLQVKEAQTSVLEPYLGRSRFGQHGQRVVEGQRLIQSSPDVFLGWEQVAGADGVPRDYYFRQLWDWKGSADLEKMLPSAMAVYAAVCGRCMARAHARTGDSVALAAYLGKGRTMTASLVEFAARYADQNERDQQAFR
ncbi:DUF2252 domain-containing protein [Dermatobacter hominis]|uniref:DUF2252 domain-containing protein n=1 Tax=Dermatobacter hominis TaxID=2884263 RepID=UPI001D0FF6B6|nr:DUF2252 domain-containing protein [Dermatobacter hominis]UDY38092.1 DUF2252 domain-containing protein [Dermatobacter hominis]